MTSTTFFFIFIPLLAFILLAVNLILAPHNPYQEKDSAFECGFHSFLGQNRTQFSISFFIFALLFLLFDLEILLVYPYVVSAYNNGIYGLIIMLIFFLALTLGFAFELGKNALKIDSRQMFSVLKVQQKATITAMSGYNINFIMSILFTYIVAVRHNITVTVRYCTSYNFSYYFSFYLAKLITLRSIVKNFVLKSLLTILGYIVNTLSFVFKQELPARLAWIICLFFAPLIT